MFLSKEESNRIKGALILLIVLGHHHVLVPAESTFFSYLYTFHVICFFMLPFFYAPPLKMRKWTYLAVIIFRNIIPYTAFFLLNFIVFKYIQHGTTNVPLAIHAWIIGSPYYLKMSTGFFFLWFLPSFMSFSVLRFIQTKRKILSVLIILVSFLTVLISWDMTEQLRNSLPFGLFNGLRFLWYGWILSVILKYENRVVYAGPFLFVVLSFFYYSQIMSDLTALLMPIGAFLTLIVFAKSSAWKWIEEIGKYSLEIYLIHIYILSVFQRLLPNTLYIGIATYLVTLLVAYSLAVGIRRTKIDFIFHPHFKTL